MKMKKWWSEKHQLRACIRCQRAKFRHEGLGFCRPCYQIMARRRERMRHQARKALAGEIP